MNIKFETIIKRLIRDMRREYSKIYILLSKTNERDFDNINPYLSLIIKQIQLLSNHLNNSEAFIRDIKIIKNYSDSIKEYTNKPNDKLLYLMYISFLSGIVYCDELLFSYSEYLTSDAFIRTSLINKKYSKFKNNNLYYNSGN